MTFKQLEYFMEVARQLSFSRAAEALYVSQSALSRSISALEDELGAILFFRNKHTVALTPAGAVLATYLPRAADELERTIELVKQVKEGMRGRMVLGVQTGLALPEVVVSAVRYCLSSMPFVAIEPVRLDARPLFEALGDGRVDFALASVIEGTELPAGTSRIDVEKEPVCLAAPAHSPLPDELAPRDVAKQTFLFSDGVQSEAALRWTDFCRSHGFMPKLAPCDGVSTCLTCIELGFGLGVLPAGHQAFALPGIRRIGLAQAYCEHTSLIWNAANLNSIVDVFAKLVEGDL